MTEIMHQPPQSQQHPIVKFKRDLGRLIEGKELALPSNVKMDAFRNAAIIAVQDNPEILRCEAGSVMKSIRTLAAAGLVPDGREAAIVPFKGKAQAMPMVSGLVKWARNSGKISSLWADVIYEGETLEVWVEDGERKWSHVKTDGSRIDAMERGGEIRGAYAVAKLTDGTVEFQPMSKAEIEKRRMASSNQRGNTPTGIWEKWYEEMAKKTVIRNLAKRLPMSSEDVGRIMVEQDAPDQIRDVTPQQEENLAAKIAGAVNQEPEDDQQIDGQVAVGHWTDEVPFDGAFPGSDQFTEGAKAFEEGKAYQDCPYEGDEAKAVDWCGGWMQAKAFNEDQPKEADQDEG